MSTPKSARLSKAQRKARQGDQVKPDANNTVTIFGGGISGLSVAHELVERGFRVYLWEPANNERDPAMGCEVGGMARTQWGAVDWLEGENRKGVPVYLERPRKQDWARGSTRPIIELPWVLYLSDDFEDTEILAAIGSTTYYAGNNLGAFMKEVEKFFFIDQIVDRDQVIYCEVQRRNPGSDERALERAGRIVKHLSIQLTKASPELSLSGPTALSQYKELTEITLTRKNARESDYRIFRLALLDGFPDGIRPGYDVRISFRVRERWLPGEHGFRFFPKFYHHLFDTMKRTPILEPAPKADIAGAQERSVTVNANPDKYVETGRTVFDNLRPTASQALAFSDGGFPAILPRTAPKSLKDVRHWLNIIFGHSNGGQNGKGRGEGSYGLTPRDVALFTSKLLQYMTSCQKRREEYGRMTWMEYLGGERAYSPKFRDLVNDSPKALVAMDAKTGDARTQGSIFTQLLIDNTEPDGFRDGTLNGPTSVAWLTHWRRYLEAQGVEFIHGKLEGFEPRKGPDGESEVIWPKVKCFEPRHLGALALTPGLAPGYFVLALPPLAAKEMAQRYLEAVGQDKRRHRDMTCLANMRLADKGDVEGDYSSALVTPAPTGAMQHMIGIQYYFDQDAHWLDGHYYLPGSPWGISAISQARFWQEKADWEHGYRGVLSVGFTKLNGNEKSSKQAWTCTRPQIAEEIWNQLVHALAPGQEAKVPRPRYWHLDTNLVTGSKGVLRNESPLLINLAGEWEARPGELAPPGWMRWDLSQPTSREVWPGYCIADRIVLAGNYMKTYTRLTTMESANESARHAVNAILYDRANRTEDGNTEVNKTTILPQPCDIWPIEEREVDDFDFLRELDEILYDRNLDHFIEILDIHEWIGSALHGTTRTVRDPTDPLAVLSQLDQIVQKYGKGLSDLIGKG
jgi:uncharacterized protein with NAD-binding domain and iron-sulfur cluster